MNHAERIIFTMQHEIEQIEQASANALVQTKALLAAGHTSDRVRQDLITAVGPAFNAIMLLGGFGPMPTPTVVD
ncbi:hypothetical protein RPMA_09550 [Tardiphaga alba]|uniref:Uncharacterized protein n=1 Tax=Tardiphaga alba TaxID=340268 RepID=A0ABX8A8R1_9BRAD|nr:hypothetical protein [Tardiphaga alba]QUS39049.1 hypothetical protein RPMA_09550 [Tardiphaga alba]